MAWLTEALRLNKETGKKETYFAAQWRERGKVRTRALGFISRAQANKDLKIIEGKLAGGLPVEPPPSASGSSRKAEAPTVVTLGRFLDDVYLPAVARDRAERTLAVASFGAKALKRHIGGMPLDAVTFAVVDDYLTRRKAEGVRSRTLILDLKCLRGALKLAVSRELIAGVPPLPAVRDRDRKPPKFLTPEESVRLLEAARPIEEQPHVVTRGRPPETRDRLTYLAILLALNLGLRKQEILTRGFEDVRWGEGPHGVLVVAGKAEAGFRVKTGRDRVVPLTPEVRRELDALRHEREDPGSGWLFPAPGAPERPRADFRKGLACACRRAGLPHMHPHALRHTWATRLAMAGVDRRTLMELGGWTEGRMLDEVYAHTTPQHMLLVMSRTGIGPPGDVERAPGREPDES